MDDNADPVLRHLSPDERILWRQMAPPHRTIGAKLLGVLLTILFAGMGTFALLSSSGIAGSSDFQYLGVVIGAVFCLIGYGGLAYGVPDLVLGWRVDYALTDRRLLIVKRGRVQNFHAAAFESAERTGDDKIGDIHFAKGWTSSGMLASRSYEAFHVSMLGIHDPARIEALIGDTLNKVAASALAAETTFSWRPAVTAPDHDPVATYLAPDERVLWRQMAPPTELARSKLQAGLVALVFVAFGSVPLVMGLGSNGVGFEPFPVILGALFCGVGILIAYLMTVNIFEDWETHYVLTDRRFLVVTHREARFFNADAFAQTERSGHEQHGSIMFDWGTSGSKSIFRQTLVGITEPARVETLIRATLMCATSDVLPSSPSE